MADPHTISSPLEWVHTPFCSSTQDLARDLWNRGSQRILVVTADGQSAGRGTWGRRWWSAPGNLLLSVVMPAPLLAAQTAELAQQAVGSVADWLQQRGLSVYLRGVNDLMARSQCAAVPGLLPQEGKLAGVLVESWNSVRGPVVTVGLGFNCREVPDPQEVDQPVISLQLCGLQISAEQAAYEILCSWADLWSWDVHVPEKPTEVWKLSEAPCESRPIGNGCIGSDLAAAPERITTP